MTPIANKIAEKYDLEIEGIDVDDDPHVAVEYAVMGIPTLILLEDGQEVARVVGSLSTNALERELGLTDPR